MNIPVFNVLSNLSTNDDLDILLRKDWWECQWDPGYWIEKVFSALKGRSFIKRVLDRVALFHQNFPSWKDVSIAKETAAEVDLPFRVTNTYAPQRVMSSSYLSLKRLEVSYEAYVETFRDHYNDEETLYKLCGNDFLFLSMWAVRFTVASSDLDVKSTALVASRLDVPNLC